MQRRIARARLLRREGKTYDEIRAVVGPVSDDCLKAWLAGIPRPAATFRGPAKEELRRECRELRAAGLTYSEIARKTGASKASLSLWLRDQARPGGRSYDAEEHFRRIQPLGAAARSARAKELQRNANIQGAEAVGELSARDLFIAGLALYWAEGSKDKPWRRNGRVVLINGDPGVLHVFLAWLDLIGVPESERTYRLNIHESADVEAQERWWADELGVPISSFCRATIKHHHPVTVRRNVGEDYHGCLVVSVARSRRIYDAIHGGWQRIVGEAVRYTESDDSPP
jgi:transcriptional regulator with XRE-family HTH domain